FKEGIAEQTREIDSIADNPAAPTFENTIEALDFSGKLLTKVSLVFFNLESAETTPDLQAINKESAPLLSEHQDNIYLNEKLFARIKTVYENRKKDSLNTAQVRLTEKYYKNFMLSGIMLDAKQKNRLRKINKELADLYIKFSDNVLAETNSFRLVIDKKEDLAGLPESFKNAAAEDAKADSMEGKWVFTIQKPSFIPYLQYGENRNIREKLYKAYINKGDNDNRNDNKSVVLSIVKLRLEKANLLGYKTFADLKLEKTMAKNPKNVYALLNDIWKYAIPKAKEELAEMQKIADKEGRGVKIEAWDWWYYAEKLRKEKYNLDEEELKPYFQLENVKDGVFMVANKLYGVTFTPLEKMPVYNRDVMVYDVKDADGSHLGILYVDYFPRPGKKAGAWMSNYREQYVENGIDIRPIICNVGNFTKPTPEMPSLLNQDEVGTLFHEFGHALHGLLSKCSYPGISGTNVATDFVELPSQLMEHWAVDPEVLKLYAKHYKTGKVIPDTLIQKIQKSSEFNQGFMTTELVAAALLDMDWHTLEKINVMDVDTFEAKVKKHIGLIPEIEFRYRSTNFSHIFGDDGYAAGYYSYLWSEVLDADAFEAFKQNGIFDQVTATAYRQNILEKGDSDDPMKLYIQFRGAAPDPDALLKSRGLKIK
ncbi:MAG: M3 family metallopeptidase, partial [Candidatus Azobacteroides sp.]|nr:M3 family metallopeptidase [Candidatus Azobacteroides sp.]